MGYTQKDDFQCGKSGANGLVTIKNILSEPLMCCTWSKDGFCRFKTISGCLIGHRSGHAANAQCRVAVVRPQHENYSNKRKFLHNHRPFKPFIPKPVTYEISPRSLKTLELMGIAV
jgi:hypothetical protein